MDMERPGDHDDLTVKAWEAMLRAHASLITRIGQEVENETGLRLSWYDVLLELRRSPERRLRMTDLASRVVLSRTRVSRVVDAMTQRGLVTKQRDASDGRATLAILTRKGEEQFRQAAPVYLDAIRSHFGAHLTKDEASTIYDALTRLNSDPEGQ